MRSRKQQIVHRLFVDPALASPLGLYAEQIDPTTRQHLGNYPQALTHAALVQAALALRDAEQAGGTSGGGHASRAEHGLGH